MKICSTCKASKPFEEFYINKRTLDGYCYQCKKCQIIYNKKWIEKNPEKKQIYKEKDISRFNAWSKKWRVENPEKIKERDAKYYKKNSEKIKEKKYLCVDTETNSLDPMQAKIVGISMSVTPGEAAYIPLAHDYPGAPQQLSLNAVLNLMKPILEDEEIKKIGQNIKYDAHVFLNHNIHLKGIKHDTMLQSYVTESHQSHGMDNLSLRHLGHTCISYEEVAGKGVNQLKFNEVDIDVAAHYSSEDADITLQLNQFFNPAIENDASLKFIYENIEMPTAEVLLKIERNGVLVDDKKLNEQSHEIGKKILLLEEEAYQLAGQPFNLASPKQLQDILFNKLGIKSLKKTPSGAHSTDEDVLQELALDYPLPKLLLEHDKGLQARLYVQSKAVRRVQRSRRQ